VRRIDECLYLFEGCHLEGLGVGVYGTTMSTGEIKMKCCPGEGHRLTFSEVVSDTLLTATPMMCCI
jgi:hypothetical protein